MWRFLKASLYFGLGLSAAVAAWFVVFAFKPVDPPVSPFDFTVKPGATLKGVSRQLADAGLTAEGESLWLLGRVLGKSAIRAGTYRIAAPITPLELLDKLGTGDVLPTAVTFAEGLTLRQMLKALDDSGQVRMTLRGKSPAEIRAALGVEEAQPEGLFFPDTYQFDPGTSDVEVLKRAYGAMQKKLAEAWAQKDPAVRLESPYEALVLASIVEKETGKADERPLIASVFLNRLRLGMKLQTDPTVIYGMGEAYVGSIRKKDLTADTPWNTYTREGLPPTPIASPGGASLMAVMRPATSDYLYFVARGDGSHQFSRSLEEHNRAVARYQLRK
jgi:UPF0755 protein